MGLHVARQRFLTETLYHFGAIRYDPEITVNRLVRRRYPSGLALLAPSTLFAVARSR